MNEIPLFKMKSTIMTHSDINLLLLAAPGENIYRNILI